MHLRGNRFCQFSKICLNFLIFHYNFWNELLHLKYILILLKQGQMCTFLSSCLSLLKFFKLYTVQASPNFDFLIVFCWIWHFLIIPSITYLVPGTADDGGEDSPGGIITSETSLAHAGAIVNDQSSNVFVTHVGLFDDLFRQQNDLSTPRVQDKWQSWWKYPLFYSHYRNRQEYNHAQGRYSLVSMAS